MNNKDLRVTAISSDAYPMLLEMCANSQIDISDLIRELASKQTLIDIRSGIVAAQSVGTRQ